MTGPLRPYRRWTRAGIAAVVACGLCCAAPLIATLVGIGALSAVGAVFEPISIGLAVLTLVGAAVLWVRRRRRRACRVSGVASGT